MNNISLVLALAWLWPSPNLQSAPLPHQCTRNCTTSQDGLSLISFYEGYSPFIYKDVAGYPTIGNGHLIKPGEHFKEPLMGDDATNLLKSDLRATERGVNHVVSVPLWQHQFDALADFAFNLGVGTLQRNVGKLINAQKYNEGCERMRLYNKARGKIFAGLTSRRAADARLCLKTP